MILGQHNEYVYYVYEEILGFSDDEITDMLIDGVITTEADAPEYNTGRLANLNR